MAMGYALVVRTASTLSSLAISANWLVCANGALDCTVWAMRAMFLDQVCCAIGWGGAFTLGSGANTLGSEAVTLGRGATTVGCGAIGVTMRRSCVGVTCGGGWYAKIVRKLSIAWSCSPAHLGD